MRAWIILGASYLVIGWAFVFEHEGVSHFLLDSAAPAISGLFAKPLEGPLLWATGLLSLGLLARARTSGRRGLARVRAEAPRNYRRGR
jgi:hypothetical protein